MGGVS